MDRRERLDDHTTAIEAAFDGFQSGIWTALPGIVQSWDPAKMTLTVQPAIKARYQPLEGQAEWISLPLLVDVPVVFQGGGGCYLTFPIKEGDECLVLFGSRCIDSWWQSGGVQAQAEIRMHDLSDGFALVGLCSLPRVLPAISTSAAQLRSKDGTAFVELQEDKDVRVVTPGTVEVQSGGATTITAPTINLNGNVNIVGNATLTGTLTNNGKNVGSTHTHGGVQTGGGTTGVPT